MGNFKDLYNMGFLHDLLSDIFDIQYRLQSEKQNGIWDNNAQ